jgi:hypothetical protein
VGRGPSSRARRDRYPARTAGHGRRGQCPARAVSPRRRSVRAVDCGRRPVSLGRAVGCGPRLVKTVGCGRCPARAAGRVLAGHCRVTGLLADHRLAHCRVVASPPPRHRSAAATPGSLLARFRPNPGARPFGLRQAATPVRAIPARPLMTSLPHRRCATRARPTISAPHHRCATPVRPTTSAPHHRSVTRAQALTSSLLGRAAPVQRLTTAPPGHIRVIPARPTATSPPRPRCATQARPPTTGRRTGSPHHPADRRPTCHPAAASPASGARSTVRTDQASARCHPAPASRQRPPAGVPCRFPHLAVRRKTPSR